MCINTMTPFMGNDTSEKPYNVLSDATEEERQFFGTTLLSNNAMLPCVLNFKRCVSCWPFGLFKYNLDNYETFFCFEVGLY